MFLLEDIRFRTFRLTNKLYSTFWHCFKLLVSYIFVCLPFQFLVTHYGATPGFIRTLLLLLGFFGTLVGILYVTRNRICKSVQWLWTPIILFLISLSIRLCVINFIGRGTTQISDFMMAFQSAKKAIPIQIDQYAIFSNWGMYVFYLKVIFKIFGMSELTGIINNAFLEAGSVVLIYYLVLLTLQDKYVYIVASTSSLLYALWPSQLVYLVLLTPEFVHIFLLLLGLVFLVLARKVINYKHGRWGIFGYMLSALCVSLSGFFKSTDKIMVIAVLISSVFFWCISSKKKLAFKIGKGEPLSVSLHAIGITVFLFSYLIANNLGFAFLDYYVGRTVNRNPTPHFMNIGLSFDSQGTWNPEVGGEYSNVIYETGFDYDKANHIIMDSIKRDIIQNNHITVQFFVKKLTDTWQGMDYLYFAQETIKEDNRIYIEQRGAEIVFQSFYLVIGILVFLGCIFSLKERPNEFLFCSALFVVGFMLLLLILESQTRYKVVTYPYICVLAGAGVRHLVGQFERSKK